MIGGSLLNLFRRYWPALAVVLFAGGVSEFALKDIVGSLLFGTSLDDTKAEPWLHFGSSVVSIFFFGSIAAYLYIRRLGPQVSAPAKSSEKFRRRTALLSEAQKLANLGWWEFDLATQTIWWSDNIHRMLGLTPQSGDLTHDAFLKFLRPDERTRIETIVRDGIESRQPLSFGYWMVRLDGSECYFESEGKFILDDEGVPVRMFGTVLEKTAQKRAEADLRRSEYLLSEAQEIAHLGNWEFDVEKGVLLWSDEIYRLLGADKGKSEPTLEDFLEFVRPEDRSMATAQIEKTLAQGVDFLFEHGIILPDGTERILFQRGRATSDDQGRVTRLFGTALDVTEVRRAEQVLRKSSAGLERKAEQRTRELAATLNTLIEGVIRIDQKGVIETFNPAAEKLFGYNADEIIGQNVRCLMTDVDSAHHDHRIADYLNTGNAKIMGLGREVVGRRKDGTAFPMKLGIGEMELGGQRKFVGTVHDVTDRHRAEAGLRLREAELLQSERALRNITDLTPVGIYQSDPDGHLTYVNDRWRRIMGLSETTALGDNWTTAMHPDDLQGVVDEWQKFVGGDGSFYHSDCRIIRPGGGVVSLISRAIRDLDEDGKLLGYVGSLTDVTDLKEAEEALVQSEGMFRALTENTADFTLIISRAGICTYVGPAAEKVSGFQVSEIIGQHFEGFSIPEDAALVSSAFNDARDNPNQTIHVPHFHARHKAGHITHYEAQVTNMLDIAGVDGIVVNMRDISERKKVELQAKAARSVAEQNRQRLNDAIESINDGFMLFDADDNLVACNSAYRLRLAEVSSYLKPGTPFEELVRVIYESDQFVAADERTEEKIQQRIWAHQHPEAGSQTIRTAEGGWVQLREYRTHDGGIAAIRTDITARIVAEQNALRARDEAEAANRAKSDFLSSMSHELRTPMNAVLGFAQLLEQDSQDLSEIHKDFVAEILQSGHHMMDLINEVLDLAKIESGNVPLDLKIEEPRPLIDSCLGMVKASAQNEGMTVHGIYPTAALPRITIDAVRFKQILLNLLSNAIKYNSVAGDVVLECDIEIYGVLRISVTDTGEGIPVDKRARVFEPFDRLGLEESGISGTGIGLTVTKRLTESMGGEIGFTSTEGKGTTFWITLPSTPDDTLT